MTSDQLINQLKKSPPASAYLFIGPDVYRRSKARQALRTAVLGNDDDENGFTRHDLDEVNLGDVMDDACSYSLFASRRLIWVGAAEGAMPKTSRAAAASAGDDDAPVATPSAADRIAQFLKNPIPDVCVVFDITRFELDGDDKTKVERARKFYSAVTNVVEFPQFTPAEARSLLNDIAKTQGIKLAPGAADYLVEATGSNASRIANELEKLSLLAGKGGTVTEEMIANMVPDARETTIFALVAAMGRKDRNQSLSILDTLVREGEYLPLALAFLATQFRLALVAREANLKGASAIQNHFSGKGVAMWRSRAEQVAQTAASFSEGRIRKAMAEIFEADRGMRDIRPDDRTVMEKFILSLTA